VTVKTIKKKQKHKGRGTVRTITKQVPNDSFFNFFSPLRGEQAGLWLQYRCEWIASDRQGVPRSSGEDGAVSCPAAAAVLGGPWVPVLAGGAHGSSDTRTACRPSTPPQTGARSGTWALGG